MRIGVENWCKLIDRWADFPGCPEKKLLVYVLASAIADEEIRAQRDLAPIRSGWMNDTLCAYCLLIGLGPSYLAERVAEADKFFDPKYRYKRGPKSKNATRVDAEASA